MQARTLVYDGDCPMCGWIADRFIELGLVDADHRRPYQSFEGDLARQMEAAGIRNEMLVLDAETSELRAGIEGFLWLLSDSRWSFLAPLLDLAPLRGLMRVGYRTIAYNRRLLVPPPRGIVCACDPDPHTGFLSLLLVGLTLVALAGAWLLGFATSRAFDSPGAVPIAVLAILAAAASLLMLRVSLPLHPFVLVGNLLTVLAVGTFVAAPGLGLSLLFNGRAAQILVGVSVGVGAWRCLRSARSRLWRSTRVDPPGLGADR